MWITLVAADFASRLTATEIMRIAQANAQGDNRAAILAEITGEMRGYVARRNALGDDGTIPDELKNAALALATVRFLGQFPDSGLLTTAREEAAKDATRLLRDVAAGNFAIVPPEVESTPQPSTPAPSFASPISSFGPCNQDGI